MTLTFSNNTQNSLLQKGAKIIKKRDGKMIVKRINSGFNLSVDEIFQIIDQQKQEEERI